MMGGRAEAEDIAQETFVRAHRALAEFRGESSLSTWLYAIASRLCLNRLASAEYRIARSRYDGSLDNLIGLTEEEPGSDLERIEREAALRGAIGELPEERRIVVVLRDLEGLSYEEIASALSLELGTVRSRLHRARLELKDKLEGYLG